ncbi:MAG: hypothetical protein U0350_04040 [Caldilineaceae bacterium]
MRPAKFIGVENYIVALTKDDAFRPALILRSFYWPVTAHAAGVDWLVGAGDLAQQSWSQRILAHDVLSATLTPLVPFRSLALDVKPRCGSSQCIFSLVGIKGPGWLSSIEWAIPALVIMGLWASVGGSRMIIFWRAFKMSPKSWY